VFFLVRKDLIRFPISDSMIAGLCLVSVSIKNYLSRRYDLNSRIIGHMVSSLGILLGN
jgi:hypothetical protein